MLTMHLYSIHIHFDVSSFTVGTFVYGPGKDGLNGVVKPRFLHVGQQVQQCILISVQNQMVKGRPDVF